MISAITVSLTHLCSPILLLNTKHHAKAKAAIHSCTSEAFFVSSFIQSWLTIACINICVTYPFSFHKLSVEGPEGGGGGGSDPTSQH